MSDVASLIADMVRAGVDPELIGRTAAALAGTPTVPAKTARQERNARYYRRLDISVDEWKVRRQAVFERDGFICQYCGVDVSESPQCDHFMPLVAGGDSAIENLVTACKSCNSAKADRLPEEWRLACQ